jgi:hypothetical protein
MLDRELKSGVEGMDARFAGDMEDDGEEGEEEESV